MYMIPLNTNYVWIRGVKNQLYIQVLFILPLKKINLFGNFGMINFAYSACHVGEPNLPSSTYN